MKRIAQNFSRAVESLEGFGFSLITGSIFYFIIDAAASMIHGSGLPWTPCGLAHHLFSVEWCSAEKLTGNAGLDYFIHRLLNAHLSWFILFGGVVLTMLCALLLKLLGHNYTLRGKKG